MPLPRDFRAVIEAENQYSVWLPFFFGISFRNNFVPLKWSVAGCAGSPFFEVTGIAIVSVGVVDHIVKNRYQRVSV